MSSATSSSSRRSAKTSSPDVRRPASRAGSAQAHFEQVCAIEDYDFTYNPKIPAAHIRDLATLRFIEAGESVILHGPVGVGKTMIAQALGHQACRRGYSVAFTKTSPPCWPTWPVAMPIGVGRPGCTPGPGHRS